MPPSRQARSRQQRQRERLAVAAARRREKRKQRQRIVVAAGALLIVIALVLALVAGAMSGNDKPKVTIAPTTVAATTVATTTPPTTVAAVKHCVGFKDTLPAGAPAVPITAGPPPTKLVTKDLKVGTGPEVKAGAKVQMNYIGVACSTGKIFDSTYGKQPFDADLSGGLIQGWLQGIPGMRVGGRRLLEIPADLAYGATGQGPIGPNEPLFFVVDALKLE